MQVSQPALFRLALEILFPRYCVLCGQSLVAEAGRGYPLCGACEDALGAIEGERCAVCGKPLISESGVCMRCRTREFGFDSAHPLWNYAGPAKDLIIAYKINGYRALSAFFADKVLRCLEERYPGAVVVPVPFRQGKMRKEGWDQVEDIARVLSARGLPVRRCLERGPGPSQKVLDFEKRLSNLRGRIRLADARGVPARAVLVDDVLTTGATLSECAGVLKAGGAVRVDAVVLAAD